MDPNVASLLSTNDPPSDIEIQQLRVLVGAWDAELAELDAQISKLAVRLSELKAQRNHRYESLRCLRKVLSPLRRFPPEILGEIFQYCCQNSIATEGYSITDPLEAPLLLGHICSFWRTVSHNTPRLW
ncbi:hypothetical protein C8R44DRAFT_657769, partial [Mycena epipterygia]